ncbi:MAG: flavin-nucleotide-binding protein [Rhodospirillales bacterium CG15_BIG_FIL_POST_REV_8_21_14_020_66_15]|nr:MAG: flavin-nucleotide-binding protein [Rhodospirillales bacterium CG15_BIG_FIL_POST_REV_8_21_14_020_66_15]
MTTSPDLRITERSKVKRLPMRAAYDRATVDAILDSGLLCHVGYVIDGAPYVTATCYWRHGDLVYWHGSAASRMLRTVTGGVPVCVTVSHLDGIVFARSGFHHSVNYRGVTLFGEAQKIENPAEKLAALKHFTDRLTPGRWEELRKTTDQELKGTTVCALAIDEGSAKVRTGGPVDDEPDYDLDVWAGVVPVSTVMGAPIADARLRPGIHEPDYLRRIAIGRNDLPKGTG